MPPRPFPLQVSIGTDIQNVARIRSLLTKVEPARRVGQLNRFMNKFLTHMEQQQFRTRFQWSKTETSGTAAAYQESPISILDWEVVSKHLSGRWAAKEAVIKAFTWRKLSPLNVTILQAQSARHQRPLYALVTDRACASHRTPLSYAKQSADASGTHALAGILRSDNAPDFEETLKVEDGGVEATVEDHYIPPDQQHTGMDGQIAKISISHDGDYATAVCLAAEEPLAGDVGGEMDARALY